MGKTIKEDHIVAAMPRIRISAAKGQQQRNNAFIGAGKRVTGTADGATIGNLTQGNLQKISTADNESRVASAVQGNLNMT